MFIENEENKEALNLETRKTGKEPDASAEVKPELKEDQERETARLDSGAPKFHKADDEKRADAPE